MSREEKERNEKFNLPLIYHFVHDEKQFYIYHLQCTIQFALNYGTNYLDFVSGATLNR